MLEGVVCWKVWYVGRCGVLEGVVCWRMQYVSGCGVYVG